MSVDCLTRSLIVGVLHPVELNDAPAFTNNHDQSSARSPQHKPRPDTQCCRGKRDENVSGFSGEMPILEGDSQKMRNSKQAKDQARRNDISFHRVSLEVRRENECAPNVRIDRTRRLATVQRAVISALRLFSPCC